MNEDFGTYTHIANLSTIASDADSDTLTYAVEKENTSEVDCLVYNNIKLNLTSVLNWNGIASCTISVNDGIVKINDTFVIQVIETNDPPVINSWNISNATWSTTTDDTPTLFENKTYLFNHTSSDVEGNPLYYSWYLDNTLQVTTKAWTYAIDYNGAGYHNVTLIVNDSFPNGYTHQYWNVTVINVNRPPTIENVPDNSTLEDTTPPNRWYNFSKYSSDPDNDALTYSITQNNSALINCMITQIRYMNCTKPTLNQFGSSTITVNVSDGYQTDADIFKVTVVQVNDQPTQNIPILNSTFKTNYTYENLTCYLNSVSDPENDKLTNSTVWLKNGISRTSVQIPFDTDYTSIKDYSGNKHNGTKVNEVYWLSPSSGQCKIGGCYNFSGTDDYINVTNFYNALPNGSKITLETWAKPKTTDVQFIFAQALQSGEIHLASTYTRCILGGQNYAYTTLSIDGNAVTANAWNYVACGWNGSDVWINVNGNYAYKNNTNTTKFCSTSSCHWKIGARYDNSLDFTGYIDEWRIYNYSLPREQQESHRNLKYDTIVSRELNANDQWKCQTTINDGIQDSNAKNSTILTIV